MKVAHVTCVYPPYRGGMARSSYDEARLMFSRGYEVKVFTHHPKNDIKISSISSDEKFSVQVSYQKSFLQIGISAFVPQLLWKLWNYENIHLQYPYFGGAEVVWFLKLLKKEKLKLVLRYHMDVVSHGITGLIFRFHTRFIMPLILKSADTIIVNSFDYVENSNVSHIYRAYPEKFVEIPFGVDTKTFFPGEKDHCLLSKHGISRHEQIILFVGGLDSAHYFKGLEYLLKAISKIEKKHKVKLVIVGQDGDLREYYEKMSKDLGLSGCVIFAGTVPQDELPKYYRLADIFCLPSIDKSEAFGIVFLEAGACGKPVVGSDLAGVRVAIVNGVDGYLVPPKNAEILAEKLNYLLDHPEIREKYGQMGREKVTLKYSYESIADALEGVWKKDATE